MFYGQGIAGLYFKGFQENSIEMLGLKFLTIEKFNLIRQLSGTFVKQFIAGIYFLRGQVACDHWVH